MATIDSNLVFDEELLTDEWALTYQIAGHENYNSNSSNVVSNRNGVLLYIGEDHRCYKSTDNGDTWAVTPEVSYLNTGETTNFQPQTFEHLSGDTFLIAWPAGAAISTDNGDSWSSVTVTTPHSNTYFTAGVSANTIGSSTFFFASADAGGSWWRSTNTGGTWSNQVVSGLSNSNPGPVSVGTDTWMYYESGWFRSTNDGVSWISYDASMPVTTAPSFIMPLSASVYLFKFSGDEHLYRTTDAGATWTQLEEYMGLTAGDFPNGLDTNVSFDYNSDNFTGILWFPDKAFYTNDFGDTWHTFDNDFGFTLNKFTNHYVVYVGSGVWVLSDGNGTTTQVSLRLTESNLILPIPPATAPTFNSGQGFTSLIEGATSYQVVDSKGRMCVLASHTKEVKTFSLLKDDQGNYIVDHNGNYIKFIE